jgi:hypothetical protein
VKKAAFWSAYYAKFQRTILTGYYSLLVTSQAAESNPEFKDKNPNMPTIRHMEAIQ